MYLYIFFSYSPGALLRIISPHSRSRSGVLVVDLVLLLLGVHRHIIISFVVLEGEDDLVSACRVGFSVLESFLLRMMP